MIFLSPHPMHIPDGFLSVLVSVVMWIVSAAAIALALRFVSKDIGERDVPVMGVLAAAIFAGQMLNFAITGGTSGHLLGAALATIVLGPWAAVLVMTAVVATQALIFQDGGLLALGANLFNMAVIGVAVSYGVYQVFRKISRGQKWGVFTGGFAAAWMSIFIASLAAALQLAASGTSPANLALPAMAGIHAIIGIGEGLITVGALSFIYAARRDLLKLDKAQPSGSRGVLWTGLTIALLLAVLSPLASANPDGLEWVAKQQGFLNQAKAPLVNIIPDYVLPGVANETIATIAASVIGTLVVLGVAIGVGMARRKRNTSK